MKVDLSGAEKIKMYEDMWMIRTFEEKVGELFMLGQITGTCHLGIGQEAAMTGAHHAMDPEDYVSLTHRDHGLQILRGSNINNVLAEIMGKETGLCKGRGGSIHLMDIKHHNIGVNNSIIGQGIPIAAGAALALKMKKSRDIILTTFGDGSTNEGAFHEGLNIASIWKLPIIFLCINNQYGMGTSIRDVVNIDDLTIRATSYGIPGYHIDGNDVLEVYETVRNACDYVRSGNGPVLIVAETYRWKGHSKSDMEKYRSKEEVATWKKKDPILRFGNELLQEGVLFETMIGEIKQKVAKIVDDAVVYAQNSPFPKEETVGDYVYFEEV